MDTSNLYVDHLAWCALIALNLARQEGTISSPAQENIFLCRWLAMAQKRRLFRRDLASDISWLLKEGREKGLSADLSGKLEYLWRASHGDLLQQNDLFRLQHIMHAITLTGINYGVLTESEWEGRHAVKLNPRVPGIYLRKKDLEAGFNEEGSLIQPLAARITAELDAVDSLLLRSGWQRTSNCDMPYLHILYVKEDATLDVQSPC